MLEGVTGAGSTLAEGGASLTGGAWSAVNGGMARKASAVMPATPAAAMVIVFISPNLAIVLGYSTHSIRQAGVPLETRRLVRRLQIQEHERKAKDPEHRPGKVRRRAGNTMTSAVFRRPCDHKKG